MLLINLLVQALNKCQLGDEVRKKEGKLDSAGYFSRFANIKFKEEPHTSLLILM